MNKTRRAEWLLLLLAAVAILGFHAKLKKGADPEQVRQLSDALRVPEEWESKVAPEPMYSPYPDSIEKVASSMRVDGGEWWTLLSTLGYVSAILAMSYLLSLMLLRRKNYM